MDVNYRESLWASQEEAIEIIRKSLSYVDIYKSSEEEIALLTGEEDLEKAAKKIISYGPKMVIVSCGPKGSFYYYNGWTGCQNTYDTKPVDTTGAGDCFMAAVLYRIIKRGNIDGMTQNEIEDILDFANAAGAQSITKRGGVSSVPAISEIENCMKTVPRLVKS